MRFSPFPFPTLVIWSAAANVAFGVFVGAFGPAPLVAGFNVGFGFALGACSLMLWQSGAGRVYDESEEP